MDGMKAWRIHRFGGRAALQCDEVELPVPMPTDVRVRVSAAGLNPVDLKTSKGHYPLVKEDALPYTLGRDCAGVVDQVGAAVTGWRPGDEVMGFVGQREGTFAGQVCVAADALARRPAKADLPVAGALPLAALTAWQGLVEHGRLMPGQRVLIHAASGGVGHLAVQFARRLGAHVIATASGDGAAFVRGLGADEVIDYRRQRFEDVVHDVDLVYDLLGGETQARSWKVLRRGGTLVSTLTQPSEERAAQHGARAIRYLTRPDGAALAQIGAWLDEGEVAMTLVDSFGFDALPEAFARLEAGHLYGKLALRCAA
ncbi:NADP-dependent oxidoreductase [Burkholderia glumae]|uniref:NADP-dependent oxidoreductase n=2 Tax=Burkholderia glumae TaxID=337 RepID=UPI001295CFF2|nr:NADP-dependent oxidoreductase [Burkholderia glumae]MCM2547980.1 NADP-dependent oxidoreductase [Burkholderia glumae]NVE21381.1 NADP-dependent oxidoreductase [Burkholderia glumae]QGA37525.1 zinc-binding dehydrogenase [Burkholderia glumae]